MAVDRLVTVYPTLSPRLLASRRRRPSFPFDQPGLHLTHLGRGAVWLALRALALGPGSRVAMPSYHCGSEVEAARLAGATIVFYRVDGALRVDEDDLARAAGSADAVYLISHFGFPPPPRPGGVPVIEDLAHGLFSGAGGAPLGRGADAAVFCPRKSLGAPDGGALLVAPGRPAPPGPLDAGGGPPPGRSRPPAPRIMRSVASLLAARAALSSHARVRRPAVALLGAASKGDAAARRGDLTETVIGEWNLQVGDMETAAGLPSRLTGHLVARADGESIRRRRRRNYASLLEDLAGACPEPYRYLPDGACPLYFPVLADDRSAAIAALLGQGVRAIEVWPVAHPLLDRERFAELDGVRNRLLALPVHQDLDDEHMAIVRRAAAAAIRRGPGGGR